MGRRVSVGKNKGQGIPGQSEAQTREGGGCQRTLGLRGREENSIYSKSRRKFQMGRFSTPGEKEVQNAHKGCRRREVEQLSGGEKGGGETPA